MIFTSKNSNRPLNVEPNVTEICVCVWGVGGACIAEHRLRPPQPAHLSAHHHPPPPSPLLNTLTPHPSPPPSLICEALWDGGGGGGGCCNIVCKLKDTSVRNVAATAARGPDAQSYRPSE